MSSDLLKTTTLYVTHDQVEAMTMADRIVVLQGGKVEQAGAPLELYDRPCNRFVAGFIGSPAMNFIPGTVAQHGLVADGVVLPLPPDAARHAGVAVHYGIRPEHFVLSDDGIAAELVLVEPMGSETQVTMLLGKMRVIAVFRERFSMAPGETIRVAVKTEAVHLFNGASGARL